MDKPNGFDIRAFLQGIDRDPALSGSRVMFFDGAHLTVLRGGPPYCAAGEVAVLKGLSRQERKRLTEELIHAHNPGISHSALKAMVRAGAFPKRYTSLQISEGVRNQLADALGAALSFTGSGTGGLLSRVAPGEGQPQRSAAGRPQSRAAGTTGRYSVGVVKAYATY
ncbi:MAG: hypothetical protein OXU20_13265 [Myxococcales bacterium]|nr:hypothetical protein [Myxococcales bacterium]